MIKCLAIDDEPLALQQLVAYIQKVPFLQLAAQCQSALEAQAFLEGRSTSRGEHGARVNLDEAVPESSERTTCTCTTTVGLLKLHK